MLFFIFDRFVHYFERVFVFATMLFARSLLKTFAGSSPTIVKLKGTTLTDDSFLIGAGVHNGLD